MRTRLYSKKKIHFVPLGTYLSSRWLVLNLVCCVCFISCQTASSTPGWQSRGERRRFVEGIVLAVSAFPDSDVSDYCWHWETQGTRQHSVHDKTLKHSNLKVDQCVKPWKGLALAFTPFISFFFFLAFTGCLSVNKFSQWFLWAGEGTSSFWWQNFLKRNKPVPNLILSSHIIAKHWANRHGSFFTCLPRPWSQTRTGNRKKEYRCYVHMCLYIHKLQALVWNWFALISEATLELGIRKRASNTREESSNTEDHSLRDGWRQPNLCGNPSVESSSVINEARAQPERWGVFLQTVDIGRIRASQTDVSLSSQTHNSCWMNGRSSLSLSYTLHFSPLFLVRSHLVQHSLHAGPFV